MGALRFVNRSIGIAQGHTPNIDASNSCLHSPAESIARVCVRLSSAAGVPGEVRPLDLRDPAGVRALSVVDPATWMTM